MSEIRLARAAIIANLKQSLLYPERIFVDAGAMFVRCGLLLFVYANVYQLSGGNINGTTFPVAAWSMFLYFSLMLLRTRTLGKEITADIQSGRIELLLTKPVNYLSFKIYQHIGEGLHAFTLVSLLSSIVLCATVGVPQTMQTFFFAGSALLAFAFGLILSYIIFALVGVAAFFIEDTAGIQMIVDKTIMTLGGSYLPVAFFPPVMRALAEYSPFGATYFITHTVYADWIEKAPLLLSLQIFWIITLGGALILLYRIAKQKLSVNGG